MSEGFIFAELILACVDYSRFTRASERPFTGLIGEVIPKIPSGNFVRQVKEIGLSVVFRLLGLKVSAGDKREDKKISNRKGNR